MLHIVQFADFVCSVNILCVFIEDICNRFYRCRYILCGLHAYIVLYNFSYCQQIAGSKINNFNMSVCLSVLSDLL